MNCLTEQLKEDIIRGGIIIAPSQSGKSTAILCVLNLCTNYIMVCHTYGSMERWHKEHPELKNQIIAPVFGMNGRDRKLLYILDEALMNPKFNIDFHYHAALLSPIKRISVYNQQGHNLVCDEAEGWTK